MAMQAHRRAFLISGALVAIAVACGGGDEDTGGSDESRDADRQQESAPDARDAEEAADTRMSGGGGFALTPELVACMDTAGFVRDAPTTGALAAWRHPDGARAVIGSSSDVTMGIADEIGTAEHPANVDGTTVIAGPPKDAAAASACLADA